MSSTSPRAGAFSRRLRFGAEPLVARVQEGVLPFVCFRKGWLRCQKRWFGGARWPYLDTRRFTCCLFDASSGLCCCAHQLPPRQDGIFDLIFAIVYCAMRRSHKRYLVFAISSPLQFSGRDDGPNTHVINVLPRSSPPTNCLYAFAIQTLLAFTPFP